MNSALPPTNKTTKARFYHLLSSGIENLTNLFTSRGYLYFLLCGGAFIITYLCLYSDYRIALIVGCLPLVFFGVMKALKHPYIAYTALFIANYLIMWLIRPFPNLPVGIIIDACFIFNFSVLLLHSCVHPLPWKKGLNGLSFVCLIWFLYCLLELGNPEIVSTEASALALRSYAVYPLLAAFLTPIIFNRLNDFIRLLWIWSFLTLLAFGKALVQKYFGFSVPELEWLYLRGGATTHIIYSGIRYFSFFSDAANFGASMGLSCVVFGISSLFAKKKWTRFYFIGISIVGLLGLLISGTRSDIAVPFAGFFIYSIIAKQKKLTTASFLLVLLSYFFLAHTHYGQGNQYLRRARSAFNSQDESYLVRERNKEKLKTYMVDRPFGAGLGHGGGKAKEFAPDAYLSQIPTDSWFVLVWVETGIVGLVLHLSILLFVLCYGIYIVLFKLKDPRIRGITGALISGIFGLMVTSYANEIWGQFPNGLLIYIAQAFLFMAPSFDKQAIEQKIWDKNKSF